MRPLVFVVDSRGCSYEHGSSHHLGSAKRRVQQDPSPERVADVVGRPAALRNEISGLPEVGAHFRGTTVPGKLHCVHPMGRRENLFESTPSIRVLGEAVNQRDRCTRARPFDPERFDASGAGSTAICHER
jgi:hypothetical protein